MDARDDAVRYWETRARELERRLDAERARLRMLASALPPDALELLELDAKALEARTWEESPVVGLEHTHTFVPSDVKTELEIVWQRLRRGDGDA